MQNPHRIRTTPSGLDNSRINKPSTTCAQPQDLTKTRQRGDVETNNITARPQQRTAETGVTSAPGKCTKNNHFSPAKAMAVSPPHRHKRAKATMVSDHRATWPTGPGCGTRGRRRTLAGRPVGGQCYKRRQTNAIHIASQGPLLQTSSIQAQKPPLSAKKPSD